MGDADTTLLPTAHASARVSSGAAAILFHMEGAARTLPEHEGWLRLRGVGRSTRTGEPILFRDKLTGAASRVGIERTSHWPGPQSKE